MCDLYKRRLKFTAELLHRMGQAGKDLGPAPCSGRIIPGTGFGGGGSGISPGRDTPHPL